MEGSTRLSGQPVDTNYRVETDKNVKIKGGLLSKDVTAHTITLRNVNGKTYEIQLLANEANTQKFQEIEQLFRNANHVGLSSKENIKEMLEGKGIDLKTVKIVASSQPFLAKIGLQAPQVILSPGEKREQKDIEAWQKDLDALSHLVGLLKVDIGRANEAKKYTPPVGDANIYSQYDDPGSGLDSIVAETEKDWNKLSRDFASKHQNLEEVLNRKFAHVDETQKKQMRAEYYKLKEDIRQCYKDIEPHLNYTPALPKGVGTIEDDQI